MQTTTIWEGVLFITALSLIFFFLTKSGRKEELKEQLSEYNDLIRRTLFDQNVNLYNLAEDFFLFREKWRFRRVHEDVNFKYLELLIRERFDRDKKNRA